MGRVVGLAFVSALNPTLVAATTIMLLHPRPRRLMLGYWLGSLLTSLALGLVIVYALEGSGFEQSSKKTVHPAITLTLAGLLRSSSWCSPRAATSRLRSDAGRARRIRNQRAGNGGCRRATQRFTFVIGILLSFPGATYLVALDRLGKLHYSTFATVLVVIGYCLVQLLLLEIPLVAFTFAPEQTPVAIDGVKAWAGAHWRTVAIWGFAVIAAGLAILGIAELL